MSTDRSGRRRRARSVAGWPLPIPASGAGQKATARFSAYPTQPAALLPKTQPIAASPCRVFGWTLTAIPSLAAQSEVEGWGSLSTSTRPLADIRRSTTIGRPPQLSRKPMKAKTRTKAGRPLGFSTRSERAFRRPGEDAGNRASARLYVWENGKVVGEEAIKLCHRPPQRRHPQIALLVFFVVWQCFELINRWHRKPH